MQSTVTSQSYTIHQMETMDREQERGSIVFTFGTTLQQKIIELYVIPDTMVCRTSSSLTIGMHFPFDGLQRIAIGFRIVV